jgi:hypothetical protein
MLIRLIVTLDTYRYSRLPKCHSGPDSLDSESIVQASVLPIRQTQAAAGCSATGRPGRPGPGPAARAGGYAIVKFFPTR